jgi:large subunit ribosomal protein L31
LKKDLHPNDYRPVVFEDLGDGFRILTKSTIKTNETTKWEDGNEYPLVKVHISSNTHPFFTGTEKLLDMEGRVDRFKARADAAEKAKAAKTAKKPRAKKAVDEVVEVEEVVIEKKQPKAKKPAVKETPEEVSETA